MFFFCLLVGEGKKIQKKGKLISHMCKFKKQKQRVKNFFSDTYNSIKWLNETKKKCLKFKTHTHTEMKWNWIWNEQMKNFVAEFLYSHTHKHTDRKKRC